MKFTTSREALIKTISIAQDVISNKSAISILSNVLLQTAENKIIVKSITIQSTICHSAAKWSGLRF